MFCAAGIFTLSHFFDSSEGICILFLALCALEDHLDLNLVHQLKVKYLIFVCGKLCVLIFSCIASRVNHFSVNTFS